MNNIEFVEKLKFVATNLKTLYVMGGIGFPLTAWGKQKAYKNDWNTDPKRKAMIEVASADTFAFDCVCLIKSVLWGFEGDAKKIYGGAVYASNSVPDISADGMINVCKNVTTNFTNIEVGEVLWTNGHVGVYIGDGLAVECTPSWENKVQITAVGNIGAKAGYNKRTWKKHGKLPYIEYVKNEAEEIAGYISVFVKEGIIEEPEKWKKKAAADKDIYWLLKKTSDKL